VDRALSHRLQCWRVVHSKEGQPLLDDGLARMDKMIRGESVLTEETMAPSILMPDAPETGLGTEQAGQAFEMDMNNISSSLMNNVELSNGIENMTWELMQSVAERGSSSNRPVDKSVPSSSNNEAINAASTPVRCLEMEQQEPPLFDEGLGWRNIWIRGETEIVEEPRAPVVLMPDEPETRQRIEKTCQAFEMILNNISSSSTRDVLLRIYIENMT